MSDAKALGYTTFEIDVMDAYFYTATNTAAADNAINLPESFTLKMSANTHLRVQPNNKKYTTLLAVYRVDNVTIDGGYLHGDRDEHDYSAGSQEWGHCLRVGACDNVIIKNMNFVDAMGDGVDVHGYKFTYEIDYRTASNIQILNNTITRARRNGISVTDGYNILIDGNTFIDTGANTGGSTGTLPKDAIDIEPYQANGLIYEDVYDVTISNNTESGSVGAAFEIFRGDRIIIEANTIASPIYCTRGSDNIIRNNTLTAVEASYFNTNGTGIGISVHPEAGALANTGNQCYGNTVTNFSTGLRVTSSYANVYNNTLNNNKTSLSIGTGGSVITNTNINSNIISSPSRTDSDGLIVTNNADLDNVNINYNTITAQRKGVQVVDINVGQSYQFYFIDNVINSGTTNYSNTFGINYSLITYTGKSIMLGDIDTAYTNKGAIETEINSRNPDYLLMAGDIYPDGKESDYIATVAPTSGYPNSGYQTLINEQKYFQTFGDHENNLRTWVSGAPTVSYAYTLDPTYIGTTIFSDTDTWKYYSLPNGNAFPADWKLLSFNDTAWSSGSGGFGSGSVAPSVINTSLSTATLNHLIRKTVNLSDISSNGLLLETKIFDGAEIYVNGNLVHSFNMVYPVTETSTAIGKLPTDAPVYGRAFDQVLRIPASYFNQTVNQIAVLLKNYAISDGDLFFDLSIKNYTFPDRGIFLSKPFHSYGVGDGIYAVAPYLPPNNDLYSLVQDNIEYFFVNSGTNNSEQITSPHWTGINSKAAYWLKTALAASTAKFKILITHVPIATQYTAYYRPLFDYVLDNADYPLDAIFHGDTHISECLEYTGGTALAGSNTKLIVANASNHFTATNRAIGAIGAAVPSNWTALYGNNTNGDNQFVEITSTATTMTMGWFNKDSGLTPEFTKTITK
jgi:parallel beta-helix repeat protein